MTIKRKKSWTSSFYNAHNLKKCGKCGEWKDKENDFNKHKKSNDGYLYMCKKCRSIDRKNKYISKRMPDPFYNTKNIKKYIKDFGYLPLFDEYINSNTKYLFKCPEGHIFEMRFGNFKKGQRCPECYNNYKRGESRKLSYNEIKEYIESYNYKLLSKEYKNSSTKLSLQCSEGHKFKMTYNSFQQGSRCPECNINKKRLSYNEIKEYIESYNYKLLIYEYKNIHTKLKLQCPEGHEFEMAYNSFKWGIRCPICFYEKNKKTIEEVRDYIESFGYKLLNKEYKNNYTKLKLQCPEGHIFEMAYGSFKWGQRCPKCNINKRKLSYNEVKEYIESYNYKLLSQEYINVQTKLSLQCPKGHIYKVKLYNFKQGKRCPICYNNYKRGEPQRLLYNEIKEYIESFDGYKLLSEEYKNNRTKLLLQCPEGHKFNITWGNFQQGRRCPICFYESTSSKPEKEVQEFVSNIYDGTVINNDRNTIINPQTGWNLELDVYLPELNKAIEFNGSYWHSLPTNNDYTKQEQCRNNNIELLTIQEENWTDNKEMCLQAIENFVNLQEGN